MVNKSNSRVSIEPSEVPKFKEKIKLRNARDLEIIITEKGFTVSNKKSQFIYGHLENDNYTIISRQEGETSTVDSILKLPGNPAAKIEAKYYPGNGRIEALQVFKGDELIATLDRLDPRYIDGPLGECREQLLQDAQKAVDKAVKRLHIAEIYKRWEAKKESFAKPTDVGDTIEAYLRGK